jgi:5-methylcytosine-specific restriction endonuclease McrBC GTP-binding regulatory subunit McrB
VVDEINRGNLAKILGELLMLIEGDKRGPEYALRLAYSRPDEAPFSVPPNLHLLGLMNTADRSLAMVDYALRRRFGFFRLEPRFASPRFRALLEARGAAPELVTRIVER